MKYKTLLGIIPLFVFTVIANADLADVKATIKKARAHVGSEEAIKSIESIQFRGTVTLNEGEKSSTGSVVLTFQKPFSQKIEFIMEDRTLATGFDGYEAFEYIEIKDPSGKPVRNIRSVGGNELRRNKAAALENLSFFKPYRFDDENIVDHGIVDLEGVSAHKIDFVHKGNIVFTRFFKQSNGDLLRSELDTGVVTLETGELEVEGIRFSDTVVGFNQGKMLYEMKFDQILINPEISDSFFDYPNK